MAARYNLREAYDFMQITNPEMGHVTYDVYKEIINSYYLDLRDSVIEGHTISLPDFFGAVGVITIQRSFSNKRINYPASLQLKKEILAEGKIPRKRGETEGEDWIVYYTDTHYNRIVWDRRGYKQTKNTYAYALKPAWHFKRALSAALKNNELNLL